MKMLSDEDIRAACMQGIIDSDLLAEKIPKKYVEFAAACSLAVLEKFCELNELEMPSPFDKKDMQ